MSKKNTGKSTEKKKPWGNLIPWQPGQSGNPRGRAKGQRNYRTLYKIALEKIGEFQGLDPDEIEELLVAVALIKGLKGDFFFHKDIMDRIHGKPKDTVDLGAGGKTLAELMSQVAHGGVQRKGARKAKN